MRCFQRILVGGLVGVLLISSFTSVSVAQIFTKTDPGAEVALGRQVAKVLEEMYGVAKDQALQERVRRIGQRLMSQLDEQYKIYTYEFRVIGAPEINACALPGGIVCIFEGLLHIIPNDDALAFVIAHELTHTARRHWAKFVKKSEEAGLLLSIIGVAAGASDLANLAVSLAQAILNASYSQEQEKEADTMGTELVWKAHFNPQGALQTMEMLRKLGEQSSVPRFLRSHPPVSSRLKYLQNLCETLATKERPALTPSMPTPLALEDFVCLGELVPVPNEWCPLAVGNFWTYEIAQRGGTHKSSYTRRVISACSTDKGTIYRLETTSEKTKPIQSLILTTTQAIWQRPRPQDPQCQWLLECLLPPLPAETVQEGQWIFSVQGKEEVATPCGRFEATVIKKEGGDPPQTYKYWWTRGIGLVKRVWEEAQLTEILIRYDIIRQATTGAMETRKTD